MSKRRDRGTFAPTEQAHEPWEATSSRSWFGQSVPLLISLALLGAGSTLVASLIGLEMSRRDFPEWTLGLIAAGFATGGILGANGRCCRTHA